MSNGSNQIRLGSFSTVVLLILALGAIPVVGAPLTGLVVDQTDGQPLLGATITARPTNSALDVVGTATDEDGTFEVELSPGLYKLSVSFVGYTTSHFRIDTEDGATNASLEARLMPKAIDLNTISVTTSRRPEKVNDAPASVSVVEAEAIAERTALTVTDHVKGLPGVDMARTGLNQTNMVTRGFNNIFSGALLVLVDNRTARVPSLRFNAYNFIPTVSDDIERIEIVSGPGSALYGPNSAAGVMHIVTKSPFGSEGTTLSMGGGERDLMLGSFRHAGSVNNRVGYKFSGQYYKGNDWEHVEPFEPDRIRKYRPTADGPVHEGDSISNVRDYDIKKLSGEARVDFLINENTSLILNGGYSQNTGIELTGLGAGQAIDWAYSYGQARLKYKDLFLQGFVNTSDAGDTYLLNTGQLIVDKSRVWSTQIQHSYQAGDKWLFTYGADAILTRPNTDATINGRNEDNDNIDEYGAYVQFENQFSEKVKFVGAARVDDHSRLEKMNFSPRAALVYQPTERGTFRFTYNRAFATPDNNNLFLDILMKENPFGTGIDLRVQGVPETGFHWNYDNTGHPRFRSQFHPYFGDTVGTYYDFDDTRFTNYAWGAAQLVAQSMLMTNLVDTVGMDSLSAGAIVFAASGMAPPTITPQGNEMWVLDLDTQKPVVVDAGYVQDIGRLEPAITETFELGYKGMLGERLRFSVDAFRTKKHNFVGPLSVETPNVALDRTELQAQISPTIYGNYMAADSATRATLDQLDGDDPGTDPIAELVELYVSGGVLATFGTFSPEEALNPNDLMITYRNFGDITYYGADFSFAYHLNRTWDFGGSYSYISRNFFAKDDEQVHDIRLNAPRNKVGLYVQYNRPVRHLAVGLRGRYVDAFDMNSPFFGSRVESYVIADLNAGINIMSDLRFTLTVQNVLDNQHIEFIGAPAIGRLATARLTQTF